MDFMAAVSKHEPASVPATRDPFDVANIEALFEAFGEQIADIESQAGAHEIADDDSHSTAVEMTGQAKRLSSAIEKKRKEEKEPFLRATQAIDGFCRPLTERLNAVVRALNSKMVPYMQEKDRQRREAQRAAEEAARKERERIDAERRAEIERAKKEAGAAGDQVPPPPEPDPVPVIVPEAVPEKTAVKTDSGSATLETKWVGTIIDIHQLPDECIQERWQHIEKAIIPWVNAQIRAGRREIPGCKIEEVAQVQTRARR